MATLYEGGLDDFAGMVYGAYHSNTVEFLRQAPAQLSERLNAAGQQFVAAANNVLGTFNLDDAMRKMRAAGRIAAAAFQTNVIRELKTIEELQNPPPCMRHLIMACPEVRTMYFNQTVDGYSEQYVDAEPGLIGHDHYDYRRVMHGIVTEEPEGWRSSEYLEDTQEGDVLYFDQQVEVLDTWAVLKLKLAEGKNDPVSRWNASL